MILNLKAPLLLLSALAALVLFSGGAAAGPLVTLKAAEELRTPTIRLSNVFEGVPAESDREIALAPEAGQSVTYDVRVLMRLAEQYRLDWQPSSVTDRATLTRAASYITLEQVSSEVEKKLGENGLDQHVPHELVFDTRALTIAVPVEQDATFSLVNFLYDPQSRRFKADLSVPTAVRGGIVPVSGRVIVKKRVPVLADRIKAGEIVGESDLVWKLVQEDHLPTDILSQTDSIIGQEARQDLGQDSFVRARDLIAPRLVVKGALVTLKTQTPLMTITTQGRALQDGARGEIVRIKNIQSNRIIEGEVESSGVVLVSTPTTRQMASAPEAVY